MQALISQRTKFGYEPTKEPDLPDQQEISSRNKKILDKSTVSARNELNVL